MTNNFKLLAIRPLKNCDERFLKNLNPGYIYKFYNNYVFLNKSKKEINDESEVYYVKTKTDNYSELYNIKTNDGHQIEINISAIVGKNGSGKSSLLELHYLLCYLISSYKGIIKNPGYYFELFNKRDNRISKEEISIIEDIQDLYRSVNVEIFYSIGRNIYSIHFSNQQLYHRLIDGKDDNFKNELFYFNDDIDDRLKYIFNELFYYTISINYSLYGLNSENNKWLNQLFHKNDGYQTPLVINPFRNKGIIDVNSEFHLCQSRLLSNLLNEDLSIKKIVNNKTIKDIVFELNFDNFNTLGILNIDNVIKKFKEELGMSDKNFIINVYNSISDKRSRIKDINLEEIPHSELIIKYIYRKVFKIALNYDEYNSFIDIPQSGPPIPSFRAFFEHLIKLREDRSHITLKLRQILNTLRFNLLRNDLEFEWITESNEKEKKNDKHFFLISLKSLSERIKIIKQNHDIDLIELIPVACFKQYLQIENLNKNLTSKNTSIFETLSSGEQQYIYSLQSIYYHITNLNSVFNSGTEKIKYNYINLILDEIELYFHPEFQRKFISDFLNGIKNLKINHIKGINILFSTHSPFILSDIPHTNILRLENGDSQPFNDKEKTFGANIHELLSNDFFLSQGLMGEWAKSKIVDLINYLTFDSNEKISDKNIKPLFNWDEKNIKDFISIIGEPIIKDRLNSLYERKINQNEKEFYKRKILEYKAKLKQIQNEENSNR